MDRQKRAAQRQSPCAAAPRTERDTVRRTKVAAAASRAPRETFLVYKQKIRPPPISHSQIPFLSFPKISGPDPRENPYSASPSRRHPFHSNRHQPPSQATPSAAPRCRRYPANTSKKQKSDNRMLNQETKRCVAEKRQNGVREPKNRTSQTESKRIRDKQQNSSPQAP